MRVLSGIQPSGSLHLGNYFGMMSKMIAHQEEAELFAASTSLNQWLSLSSLNVIHSKFILFYPYK